VPAMQAVFPFAKTKEAHLHFGERKHIGKVVISGD
jgi:NADPH:quinone reductase-like Zn-dependent oxidoreductase